MPEGRQAQVLQRQGEGRQAGQGREGVPDGVHATVQGDRGADRGARSERAGLRRAANGARGTGDRRRDDAAGLPEEGPEASARGERCDERPRTAGARRGAWAPLLAAVAVGVAWRGGYTDGARGVVTALAGLAALAAVAVAPVRRRARGAPSRRPRARRARAGHRADRGVDDRRAERRRARRRRDARAVRGRGRRGLGARAVGARGRAARRRGRERDHGLVATIATSEPLALDLCGSWRPAGPFEYPPALALVCVSALPVALCAATDVAAHSPSPERSRRGCWPRPWP